MYRFIFVLIIFLLCRKSCVFLLICQSTPLFLMCRMTRLCRFYLGPAGSGSPWHWQAHIHSLLSPLLYWSHIRYYSCLSHTHTHHRHGDAWNAIAYGEKIWSLLPPAKAAFSNLHSYHTHFDRPWTHQHHEDNHNSTQEKTDGSTTTSSRSSSNKDSTVGVIDALHCVQEAGDIMYVPTGWAHAILNTRETVGVASEFRYTFNHFA